MGDWGASWAIERMRAEERLIRARTEKRAQSAMVERLRAVARAAEAWAGKGTGHDDEEIPALCVAVGHLQPGDLDPPQERP